MEQLFLFVQLLYTNAMSNCEHVMEGPHQHAPSPTNIWTKRSSSHHVAPTTNNFRDMTM